jgi:hypothetical protein
MKTSLLLSTALCCALLLGCSSEAPSAAGSDAGAATPAQSAGADNTLQAKADLEQQLRPFKRDARVYEDSQVLAALESTRQAQMAWVQARDTHPALLPLVEKANDLISEATREAQTGDSTVAKRLAGEAAAAKVALEQAALREPDLAPLNQARQDAQRAVERAEIEALKRIPDARELAQKLEALIQAQ